MLLYIEILGMRAQAETRREPGLAGRPLVLLQGRRITDLSREAAALGLSIGQEVSPPALVQLGAVWRQDPGAGACEELQKELRARLSHYAQRLMTVSPEAAALELWDKEEGEAALAASGGIGWRALGAFGQSVRLTQALVRAGVQREVPGGAICIGDRTDIPLAVLDWLGTTVRRRLGRLGLQRVGEVQAIGRAALWEQIGREARELWEFALGQEPTGFRPERPEPEMSVRQEFGECGCANREELAASLRAALTTLRGRLPVGRAVTEVELLLSDEGGGQSLRRRALLRPARREGRIAMAILALAFGEPPPTPLRSLRLRLVLGPDAERESAPGLFQTVPARPMHQSPRIALPARELRLIPHDPYRQALAEILPEGGR